MYMYNVLHSALFLSYPLSLTSMRGILELQSGKGLGTSPKKFNVNHSMYWHTCTCTGIRVHVQYMYSTCTVHDALTCH